ncbi:MAG: hypothetical protein Q4G07_05375, partial [Oscillospiraceae bacterium]|nr:hypothetical protein [Oscillospiraceae bacterium]
RKKHLISSYKLSVQSGLYRGFAPFLLKTCPISLYLPFVSAGIKKVSKTSMVTQSNSVFLG